MSQMQSWTVRLRGQGFRALCASLLALVGLGLPVAEPAWSRPPTDDALVNVNGCTGVRVRGDSRSIHVITAVHCVRGAIGIYVENPKAQVSVSGTPVFQKDDVVVIELLNQPGTSTFLKLQTAVLSTVQPEPGETLWMLTAANDTSEKGPAWVTLYTPAIPTGVLIHYNGLVFKQIWMGGIYRGYSGSPFYWKGAVIGTLSVGLFRYADQATYWGGYSPISQEVVDWLSNKAREQ